MKYILACLVLIVVTRASVRITYKITSLLTLAFMDDTGKEIRRIEGGVTADVLIDEAKITTGEY